MTVLWFYGNLQSHQNKSVVTGSIESVSLAGCGEDAPGPTGLSLQFRRLAAGGGICGGLENWRGREAPLSLGSGSRLPAPGSRLLAPGTPCPARSRFSKDVQPKRGGVRTREAVSSDPPAVRSPAEPGSCRDGAAAPAWSPAPCRIRLREGGRGGRAGRRRGSAGLRIAAEGRLGAGQDPRPSRAGEGGQRGRRCLRPWGGRVG